MSPHAPPAGAVLCAGFGTRMAPLTDGVPKPLLPFLNTPMLAYALDHLSLAGATRVGMNVHHLADSVPPVGDRLCASMNLDPTYVREWDIMGTAGGIRGIWDGLDEPETTLAVFNGDSVMNIDSHALLQAHRGSGARVTMVVRRRQPTQPGGVWVDEQNEQLSGLLDARHPEAVDDPGEYLFCGVHFIESDLLEEIPLEEGCIVQDVYMPLLEDGERINVEIIDGFWAGLDNPKLLFETTRRVLDDPSIFDQVPMPEPSGDGIYVFSDNLDEETTIEPPVLVGPHVEAGPDVEIGPYAVVDGTDLRDGASIRNSIVYGAGRTETTYRRCVAVAGKVANLPRLDTGADDDDADSGADQKEGDTSAVEDRPDSTDEEPQSASS